MKKVLIIGAGGIGSYFSEALFDLIMKNQIDLDGYEFYIADMDSVEQKNVLYQNFTTEDLFNNKAKVIGDRYRLVYITEKIEEQHLAMYDMYVVCADNGRIRKEVFEHSKNFDKPFLDLRSEGRTIAFFTHEMSLDELNATLNEETLDNSGSCQLKHEFEKGIIQVGNKIIALIGAQLFLNYIRQQPLLLSFIQRF